MWVRSYGIQATLLRQAVDFSEASKFLTLVGSS